CENSQCFGKQRASIRIVQRSSPIEDNSLNHRRRLSGDPRDSRAVAARIRPLWGQLGGQSEQRAAFGRRRGQVRPRVEEFRRTRATKRLYLTDLKARL